MHGFRILAPLGLLLSATIAGAADRSIDPSSSRLTAEFTQIGVPVSGPFTRFNGHVAFDPAKPSDAKAHIEIDTTSFDLGEDNYNDELRKKEWFDSARYPAATFDASGLKPLGGDRFEALGRLSLKGRQKELKIPVTVKTEAATTVVDGVVPISRKDFTIGAGSWDEVIEDLVKIKFHIVVTK